MRYRSTTITTTRDEIVAGVSQDHAVQQPPSIFAKSSQSIRSYLFTFPVFPPFWLFPSHFVIFLMRSKILAPFSSEIDRPAPCANLHASSLVFLLLPLSLLLVMSIQQERNRHVVVCSALGPKTHLYFIYKKYIENKIHSCVFSKHDLKLRDSIVKITNMQTNILQMLQLFKIIQIIKSLFTFNLIAVSIHASLIFNF